MSVRPGSPTSRTLFAAALPIAALLLLASGAGAQDPDEDPADAGALVRSLYDIVSAGPRASPDWEAVRALFLPEAVIVLRTSREATTVFTVDGFLDDFRTFYASPDVVERGFRETVLELRATEVGDMAQVWVLYEARVPDGRGNRGVDAFLLVRREGGWRVAAVTNEVPSSERPLPGDLFD